MIGVWIEAYRPPADCAIKPANEPALFDAYQLPLFGPSVEPENA